MPSTPYDPEPSLIATASGPISVTREGPAEAPAVICIHGIPGSVRDFRYLAPLLAETFCVVRVDAPGFGGSPRSGDVRSVRGWGETLHAVADALDLRRPYVLLGHSFGGGAALHGAAVGGGRVGGLVLISAPGPRRHKAYLAPSWVYRTLALLVTVPVLRRPLGELGRQAFRKLRLRPPRRGDWRTLHDLTHTVSTLRFDELAGMARSLTCPTLVCHSHDDPLVQVAIAEEAAALFARSERLIFEDGGHYPQKHHAAAIATAVARRFGDL